MRPESIPLNQLLLDPNNYRFVDLDGYTVVAEQRFGEAGAQQRANARLRAESTLIELKRSIMVNGFLPVERIVVRPYGEEAPQRFVVVEGNRRVAAARWIIDDHQAGVEVPEHVLNSITSLPCLVIEEEEVDEAFRASLMGIRHVSGIKQWGGYQRAKLVADMKDGLGMDTAEISARLAMSAQEVNRRYKAFRALQQMKNDEEFGEFAEPKQYPIFHEAVSLPAVRDWLNWNPATNEFVNDEARAVFYSMLAPRIDEETGEEVAPKISSYSNVRDLRVVLSNPEAREVFLEPEATIAQAVAVVEKQHLASSWVKQVREAVSALNDLPRSQLRELSAEQIELIQGLIEAAQATLDDNRKIND